MIVLGAKPKKRILVLPGGGAAGIISIRVLQSLENQLERPTSHFFDEIWASSVGSMIAAYLTEPISEEGSHQVRTAQQVGQLIRESFSGPWNALGSLSRLKREIHPRVTLANTVIPLKIITAKINSHSNVSRSKKIGLSNPFLSFKTESIGLDRDSFSHVSLVDAVFASCSVYPIFRPHRLSLRGEDQLQGEGLDTDRSILCIDAGCVQCSDPILNPTRFFLRELISRGARPLSEVQIFFISNGWARWKDEVPKGVEVFNFDLDLFPWFNLLGSNQVGQFIAANCLGAGLVPSSFLDSVAKSSIYGKNWGVFQSMVRELRTLSL